MFAQVGREQQVVILVRIHPFSPTGQVVLSCTQRKSEGEYMGLGGSVPIPGGGSPTVSIWASWSPAAASRAAASAAWLPRALAPSPFWCPGTCTMDTARGKWTVAKSLRISGTFLISFPPLLRGPALYIWGLECAQCRMHIGSQCK